MPLEQLKERGIEVFNARSVYGVPMAEYAICAVLDLYKKSRVFYENQKQHQWIKQRDVLELYGKSALIVGAGNIGTECAKRLGAFGVRVRGVDLYPREDGAYEEIAPLSDLESELARADVVILTLPLTEDTRRLFDREKLAAMKQGAILVNIARGAIVDLAALIEILESGRLGGAVLDVFEEEPLCEDSPLWSMDNVIVTPHNSFVGDGYGVRLFDVIKSHLGR